MKEKLVLMGMLALALTFGMAAAGCGGGNDDGGGGADTSRKTSPRPWGLTQSTEKHISNL